VGDRGSLVSLETSYQGSISADEIALLASNRDRISAAEIVPLRGNEPLMVNRALPSLVRSSPVWPAVLAATALMSGRAQAIGRPRIAVALERAGELAFPRDFGDGVGGRALAQGVREACLEPVSRQPRTKRADCATLSDVPDAQLCVDETLERALTLEIRCEGSGASAEALDLSRSGCDAADCFAVEAKRTGATDLLLVRGAWKDGLSLTGTITNLATGRSRTVSAQDVEKTYNSEWPRSGPQVLALLKWFSRRVALDVLSLQASGPESAGPQAPLLVAPSAPPEAVASSSSHRWIGWTLLAAGALVGTGAAVLWRQDKELAGCAAVPGDADPCRELRRTIVPAIGLGAGAAAAILAGSIVLVGGRSSEAKLAISAQLSGVTLGGRF
jgi:hypothetical protein